MAEEKDLKFRVSADIRELERALDKVKKGLGDTEEATEDLNEEMERTAEVGGRSAGSLADMAVKGAAAYAAFQALTEGLAAFERRAGIINRFDGDISNASDRVNGLASNIELMAAQQAIASRGLRLGTKDFGNFAVAVQEYAAATGKDATQVQEEFTEAIGTGSAEALNKFGIQLGGVTDKQEAQRIALAQLEEKYGDVSSSADTFAGFLGTVGNQLSNVADELVVGINSITELDDSQRNLNGTTEQSIGFWDRLTTVVGEGVASVGGFIRGLIDDLADVVIAFESVGAVIEALIDRDFDKLKSTARTAAQDIEAALVPDKAIANASKSYDKYQNKAQAAAKAVETSFEDVGKAITATGTAAKNAGDEVGAFIATLANTGMDKALFIGPLEEAEERAKALQEEIDELAQRYAAAQESIAGQTAGSGGSVVPSPDDAEESKQKLTELQLAMRDLFHTGTSTAQEFAGDVANSLATVEGALGSAIEQVVAGEATMSEAFERMIANILVSLGNQLVADGLKNMFLGLGRILTSYGSDVTGSGLVALGAAEIAGGVALGAAGAAVTPPSGAGAEASAAGPAQPSGGESQGQGQARAEQTTVININSPVPKEYMGRTINDATRAAARRGVG